MDETRKFLFNYRYDGDEYGLDVVAATPEEAKARVRAMSLARYEGEIHLTVHIPMGGLIARFISWARGNK